jgi:hypothetical protein
MAASTLTAMQDAAPLTAAGLLAGAMNAIAGGGSFISFLPWLPPDCRR